MIKRYRKTILNCFLIFEIFALTGLGLADVTLLQSFEEYNIIGDSRFGHSVSGAGDVNGDGYDDVVVGAYYYNRGTGRAYVYFGGPVMDDVADVTFTGEGRGDYFGHSVSGACDVNGDGFDDVVVGAYRYDSEKGRTYVYYGGAAMDNTADVMMTGAQYNDFLGWSVSGVGDLNGDGFDDIIVGAVGLSERVHVYYGGSPMNEMVDIFMIGENRNDWFGHSISGAGDVNDDGYDDIIIGAPKINNNTGRIYIYYGSQVVDATADVTITGENEDNYFGRSVSCAGDINGDGDDDVIVGADGYDSGTGRVYVYFGGPSMDVAVDATFNGEDRWDRFGESVSAAGDVNGDGYDDIVVGAWNYEENNDYYIGRSYLFLGSQSLDDQADVTMIGEGADNYFGDSVSGIGDVNGDGWDDIIVGAWGHFKKSGYSRGRIYMYYGGQSLDNNAELTINGEGERNQFGCSVSGAGDVNGDGYDDVIVGAYGYNWSVGRAYIYFGSPSMDSSVDVIINGEDYSFFGSSVSGAGDVNGDGYDDVVVGADDYNSKTGRAYVYVGGLVMDTVADMTLTGESINNLFGRSVSGADDVNGDGYDDIIVGAPGYDDHSGRTYLYFGGTTLDNDVDVIFTGEGGGFGNSVSGAGDINGDRYDDVVVGAKHYNSSEGRAYVYYGDQFMDNGTDLIMTSEGLGEYFGCAVSRAGDVNGDGFDDMAIGADGRGRVYLYFGSMSMDNEPDVIYTSWDGKFGNSISDAGDVNGDGYDDLVIGNFWFGVDDIGRAYVFLGGQPVDNNADAMIDGEGAEDWFGMSVSGAGDVNGDGYDEIIIGTHSYGYGNGKAYIYMYDHVPIANFTADTTFGYKPFTVQFSDSSAGVITDWLWDFGDGGTSTAQNPEHTYTTADSFTVSLTVIGPGGSDIKIRENCIVVIEPMPIANFAAGTTYGGKPLTVQFNDSSAGVITDWLWDFGDGQGSTEQNPEHTYAAADSFTVSLTVTGPGGSDIKTREDYIIVTEPTGVDNNNYTSIPNEYRLFPNYPNPFNPETTIQFALPAPADISISIYSLKGAIVKQIFEGKKEAGYHSVIWNALDNPSGTYIIKMQAGNFVQVQKCILIK